MTFGSAVCACRCVCVCVCVWLPWTARHLIAPLCTNCVWVTAMHCSEPHCTTLHQFARSSAACFPVLKASQAALCWQFQTAPSVSQRRLIQLCWRCGAHPVQSIPITCLWMLYSCCLHVVRYSSLSSWCTCTTVDGCAGLSQLALACHFFGWGTRGDCCLGRAQLKPDGRWRTGEELNGEKGEWSGQPVVLHSPSEHCLSNIVNNNKNIRQAA